MEPSWRARNYLLADTLGGLCLFTAVVAGIVAAVAWAWQGPDEVVWGFRIVATILCVAASAGLYGLTRLPDDIPDHLAQVAGRAYFTHDGLSFTLATRVVGAVCHLELRYQNSLDRPLVGRVVVRPTGSLFGDEDLAPITCEIACAPAEFGVARVPVGIPPSAQGRTLPLQLGASVEHPAGHGNWLRSPAGTHVQKRADFTGPGLVSPLTVAGLLAGHLVLHLPDIVRLDFPCGAAVVLPDDSRPEVVTLWKLGDPPFDASTLRPTGERGANDRRERVVVAGLLVVVVCAVGFVVWNLL